jgi:hypothetical protein
MKPGDSKDKVVQEVTNRVPIAVTDANLTHPMGSPIIHPSTPAYASARPKFQAVSAAISTQLCGPLTACLEFDSRLKLRRNVR